MTVDSIFEAVRADLTHTVASYFAPVRAVIDEVSRAVTSESHRSPTAPADDSKG